MLSNIAMNPEAEAQGRTYLATLGTGSTSGPTFEETLEQDNRKAQAEAIRDERKAQTEVERERMKLGAKMQEAAMKNEITMQQSRESNALDFEKHKMTTRLQAAQPQQAQPNQTAQTAVSNQYYNNDAVMKQIPQYLGSIG